MDYFRCRTSPLMTFLPKYQQNFESKWSVVTQQGTEADSRHGGCPTYFRGVHHSPWGRYRVYMCIDNPRYMAQSNLVRALFVIVCHISVCVCQFHHFQVVLLRCNMGQWIQGFQTNIATG